MLQKQAAIRPMPVPNLLAAGKAQLKKKTKSLKSANKPLAASVAFRRGWYCPIAEKGQGVGLIAIVTTPSTMKEIK